MIVGQTGYPSIDKPWLKYYDENQINEELPVQSIYEYMYENNKDHLEDIALIYLKKKITYGQLIDNISIVEKALIALGVKKGDIVTVAMPSTPEAVYCVYALNKIRAVANMIHPLAGSNEIVDYLNEVRSTVFLMFTGTYAIIKDVLDKTNVSPICNGYGQNEMCGAITLNGINKNKNGSAGYLTSETELRIVDPTTLELVDDGKEGLILERSTSVFDRYENLPFETENAFVTLADGTKWFNTHDLGYMDDEGFLFISGRVGRIIIRQDFKVLIDTIEDKIKQHKNVKECAVIPVQAKIDEEPIAFIIAQDTSIIQSTITELEGEQYQLSELEKPSRYIVLEKIPYLGSGKIDYQLLKQKYLAGNYN